MVTDPYPGDTDLTASGDDLAARAVVLAQRWITESAEVDVDPAAERLAGVLKDPNGLPFTIGFVDGVMRPESLTAAAANLSRVAPLVPGFLPWYLRGAVRLGGAVAPVLPSPVVPIARRVLREMVGHLVVDARPEKLGPAIAAIRESGAKLNLNLLGEAVLGEHEALRRLEGIHELIRRPDVDYVSVKVSAIASHISMWAFDEVVDKVVERLMPLYLTAADGSRPFINLDMEEYRDLDLTIAVFTRILEDPRLQRLEAGIVLQAYLPDALPALQQLTAWAQQRVAAGGARIKVRLVKGANLAMERVDAVMHGWPLATYDAKVDSDANYVRCLDFALRPENTAAVRIGVAGHNLFDIAYAWLLAGGPVCGTMSSSRCSSAWRRARSPRSRARSGTCCSTCRSSAPTSSTSRSATSSAASKRTRRATTSSRRRSSSRTIRRCSSASATGSSRRSSAPPIRRCPSGRTARRTARTAPPESPRTAHARASRRRTGRGRRADAGGASASPDRPPPTPTTRRRSPPRPRRSSSSAASRFVETAVFAPRESGARAAGAPGLPQRARHRPGAARQPGVGARDPRPHRDLDGRRRDHRGRARGRRADARGRSSAGEGCRGRVGCEARCRALGRARSRPRARSRRAAASSSRSRHPRPARCSPRPMSR